MIAEVVQKFLPKQRRFLTIAQHRFIREREGSGDIREDTRLAFERMDELEALGAIEELHRRRRAGMTLIELLVVIAILLILVTAATAMMNVAANGREQREAARQLNAMIAGCMARAAETNRPFGIWLARTVGNQNAAREVFYAQTPPLYVGDAVDSGVIVKPANGGPIGSEFSAEFYPAPPVALAGPDGSLNTADDLLLPGDRFKFGHTGAWYNYLGAAMAPGAGGQSRMHAYFEIGTSVPPVMAVYQSGGEKQAAVAFTVRRRPQKSIANPLQMPGNTCVDLSRSGVGPVGAQFSEGVGPVLIMVDVRGIEGVYFDTLATPWKRYDVTMPVHLLVGDSINIGPNNIADVRNRWVTLHQGTAGVITTENLGVTEDRNGDGQINFADARHFANLGSAMSGN